MGRRQMAARAIRRRADVQDESGHKYEKAKMASLEPVFVASNIKAVIMRGNVPASTR